MFAAFSRGSFESTDLGNGAVLPAPVLSQPSPQTGCARPRTCDSFALLRYRPGTDLRAAAARLIRLTTHAGCPPGSCVVISDQRPDDIRNYSRVRDTPWSSAASWPCSPWARSLTCSSPRCGGGAATWPC